MRQRVVNEQLYISPIFTIFFTDEYRSFSPLFNVHDFVSEASIFPLFTVVFHLVKLLVFSIHFTSNFNTFYFFSEERQWLMMRHLFGIGVTESPILQTMRQRVAKRNIYISPFVTRRI